MATSASAGAATAAPPIRQSPNSIAMVRSLRTAVVPDPFRIVISALTALPPLRSVATLLGLALRPLHRFLLGLLTRVALLGVLALFRVLGLPLGLLLDLFRNDVAAPTQVRAGARD